MHELVFGNMDAARLAWLTSAIVALALYATWRRRQSLAALADGALQPVVLPGASTTSETLRFLSGAAAFVLLVAALTDPRLGSKAVEIQRRSADIMFVLDTSRSMLAQDASPSRLEREKQFTMDAIDRLAGDRVGLVDFAGVATLRSPLTLNYGAVKGQVKDLTIKQSYQGGSDLSQALRLAVESFPSERAGGRAIIVLSDGEDLAMEEHETSPVEEAGTAWSDHGIRVITVGLGDEAQGARIPVGARYLVHDGQEVWTKMDGSLLREMALSADGSFIPAGTAQVDLGAIVRDLLADLDRVDRGVSSVQYAQPRFQWPAAAALVFLLVQSMIPSPGRRERFS
ncbi:MAG: VWA domain-containing protein [Planctomycetota bacterium]|nr:VWA domain-containing protein [Planctomycetota bacterium]MDA1104998.1 VWA domain-containing protein [Planctomycetota bacterium]